MTNPQPAVRVDARAEPADQWRKLALQFDMHRIDALSVLRGVVAGTVSTEDVRAFLAAPPRASAITPAPTEAGGVREALTAIIADWDSRSVGEQERFVPPSDGVPGYWSPNARMVSSERIAAGRAALSSTPAADAGKFKIGNPVRKTKGSHWQGRMINAYLHDSKAARLAPPQPAGDET